MPTDPTISLSEAGEARSREILRDVLADARRRRRARAVRRTAGTAAVAALAAVLAWPIVSRRSPPVAHDSTPTSPTSDPAPPAATSATPDDSHRTIRPLRTPAANVQIVRIATDAGLSDRWAIRPITGGVERIDDAGLMDGLSAAGLSGGVVVRAGRPELWWQPTALHRAERR